MADFSRLIQKGKHDISSLDLIDDVGTLFSFDEDSPDGGTVNIDYSSSDRNNRTSSLDGSQESNSDAYTWVGSFSDAQTQPKSAESKWKSPTYGAISNASAFSTAGNVAKSPVISNPASPFKDSSSPLFLPSAESSKNIWGAPNLNLGGSVFKPTIGDQNSTNQDALRLVPSELLKRNGPFAPESLQQQQPSMTRPVSQKTKLNPHSVPFEYNRQSSMETSIRSLKSLSVNDFMSFDLLSSADSAGLASNFAEASMYTPADSSASHGLLKGFASSASSPSRNMPAVLNSFVFNAMDNNSMYAPKVANQTALLAGSTANGATSSPADHLRIVKEIQTSKLKVDESKLTTEYFEQLTREAEILQFHICSGIEDRARQEIAFASVRDIARRAFGEMDLSISLGEAYSKFTPAQLVEKLGVVMKNAGMRDVKMLTRARVPVVKIREPSRCGMRCDISFQSNLVLYNTRLLQAYSQIDPRFRELKILPDGTIAEKIDTIPVHTVEGFNVYFYENVNALRQIWTSENNESVGELIVAFFKYYSAEFPYVHGIASVRTGMVVPKEDKGWTKEKQQELNRSSGATKDRFWLCVEDPFETTNNVGRPVDKETLFEVRGEFIRASKILCAGGSDESVLARVCEKAQVVISKKGTTVGMMRKW
ncbi:hypothetical protein HDU84_009042 [Entophlyctis sp. JEL0112]|nr:hypothetical protein HDU84_009042 [Entophlyctis sp. JEL0112]